MATTTETETEGPPTVTLLEAFGLKPKRREKLDDDVGNELAWYAARNRVQWRSQDRRWYVEDKPVHAGIVLEILTPDGWRDLGIESQDSGRELHAMYRIYGMQFSVLVAGFSRKAPGSHDPGEPFVRHPLRWPR